MGKILIDQLDRNHDAWIAQKASHTIGSGDIATVLNANPYQTPLQLWAIKTRREKPQAVNDYMVMGTLMEPVIAEVVRRKLSLKLRHGNALYAHDDIEWARATPDYFAESHDWHETSELIEANSSISSPALSGSDELICEIKNISAHNRFSWEEDTPLMYRFQVMWQMGVVGKRASILAPLIGGDIRSGFLPRAVTFDECIFGQMVELAEKFIWHCKNDTPPDAQGADLKLINQIYPPDVGLSVDLDPIVEEEIERYEKNRSARLQMESEVKLLKEREDEAAAKIRAAMKGAGLARCGTYTLRQKLVAVKESIRKGYTYTHFSVK